MFRRSVVAVALAIAVAACSSSGSDSAVSSPELSPVSTGATSMPSHMMGMATGPDPEPAEVDASPYVLGILPNGTMVLDPGVKKQVAVVAQGEPTTDGVVPVVVRNMTRDTVYDIQGHLDLLDANEQVVDSGAFSMLSPLVVAPGEIAFGAMFPGDDWDLAGGTLRAKVDSFNVMAPDPQARSMAVVTQASVADGEVTGTVTNDTDTALTGGVSVTAMCFDTIRRPFHVVTTAVEGDIPAGESVDFVVPLQGDGATCAQILLTATEID